MNSSTVLPANRLLSRARFSLSRRAILWLAGGFAALVFIVFRLATFTPQPLDSPHTLRPVLNSLFGYFLRLYDRPETAYENWRAFCLIALLLPAALASLNFARANGILKLPQRAAAILCSRTLSFTVIAAVLLLCRFPSLLDYQLNPDEGQFLTAAHKLFYDASFFHSVDCGTSGPLNVYPLMLPAVVGLSPDYASSRIIVLIVAFSVIYLLYRSVALLAPDSIARIAILPVAGALAVFEHTNLVHYSSEQIPVLLISLALYLTTRVLSNPAKHQLILFLLGLLISAAFFAKMQSVPIVGAIAVVALFYVHATDQAGTLWRPSLLLICGTLSLLLLNAVICLADGVWTNFWISYIVSNRRYADVGTNFATELPAFLNYLMGTPELGYFLISLLALAGVFVVRRSHSNSSPEQRGLLQSAAMAAIVIAFALTFLLRTAPWTMSSYVAMIAIFVAPFYFLLFYDAKGFGTDPVRWFGFLASMSAAVALFSVYRPHRPFPHYLFFLFPSIAAIMAWMLLRQSDLVPAGEVSANPRTFSRLAFPLVVVVLSLSHATYLWGSRDAHQFHTVVATIRSPQGDFIRSLTTADGRIFVWGWTPEPYLSSGRVSPTRDYNMFYLFQGQDDLSAYYQTRLLHDLSQNPPELIIDAVGDVSWAYGDRGRYSFEQFPEISKYIGDFYSHLTDAYGERFFIRRDLAEKAASVKPRVCSPAAVRCVDTPRHFYIEGATTLVMDDQQPLQMPAHALVEVDFTPMGRQPENATILNNEAVPNSFRGLRFQNIGGDEYRLILGLGDHWVFSKPITLPPAKPVSLAIELDHNEVHLRTNGAAAGDLHLTSPMADAPGRINIGTWIDGNCRFSGAIQFFQIVDLDKTQRPGA